MKTCDFCGKGSDVENPVIQCLLHLSGQFSPVVKGRDISHGTTLDLHPQCAWEVAKKIERELEPLGVKFKV